MSENGFKKMGFNSRLVAKIQKKGITPDIIVEESKVEKVKKAIDMAYEAVKSDEKYRPSEFVKAIENIKKSRKWYIFRIKKFS